MTDMAAMLVEDAVKDAVRDDEKIKGIKIAKIVSQTSCGFLKAASSCHFQK